MEHSVDPSAGDIRRRMTTAPVNSLNHLLFDKRRTKFRRMAQYSNGCFQEFPKRAESGNQRLGPISPLIRAAKANRRYPRTLTAMTAHKRDSWKSPLVNQMLTVKQPVAPILTCNRPRSRLLRDRPKDSRRVRSSCQINPDFRGSRYKTYSWPRQQHRAMVAVRKLQRQLLRCKDPKPHWRSWTYSHHKKPATSNIVSVSRTGLAKLRESSLSHTRMLLAKNLDREIPERVVPNRDERRPTTSMLAEYELRRCSTSHRAKRQRSSVCSPLKKTEVCDQVSLSRLAREGYKTKATWSYEDDIE